MIKENGGTFKAGKRALLPILLALVVGAAAGGAIGSRDAGQCQETNKTDSNEISLDNPGTMEYLSPVEGYQNGVFVVINGTFVRLEQTMKDSIVYVKVGGERGKITTREKIDEARTQDVDRFTGREVGFRINDKLSISEAVDRPITASGPVMPWRPIGSGIDAFLKGVRIGDKVQLIDAIITNPSASAKEEIEANARALKQLQSGECTSKPPVFSAYAVMLAPK